MARTAYIHIPFCAHKCDFCDFAAFAGVDQLSARYVEVVCEEIRRRLAGRARPILGSVHYGGGTPGYMEPSELARVQQQLLEFVDVTGDLEVAIETTPQTVTPERCQKWLDMGVNRLCIGVQSFVDAELSVVGRDHDAACAKNAVGQAKAAGFTNIGIDLMYGLPGQTLESWRQSIETGCQLPVSHLSAYGLVLEVETPLRRLYPPGSPSYPSEVVYGQMYETLVDTCDQAGLAQYEISNFARPGFASRHNVTYWQNQEYFAFGVSAHRYVDGVRSSNWRSLERYMREPLACETVETVEPGQDWKDGVMLGLRLTDGIALDDFARRYGFDLRERSADKLDRLVEAGMVEIEAGYLRLSRQGVLVSNSVIVELL